MGNLSQVLIGQRNCGGEWKWIIIMKKIRADEGTDAKRSLKWTSSLNARRKISISFLLQQSLKRFFNWYSERKVYIKSRIYAQKTNNSCDSSEQMAKIFLKPDCLFRPFLHVLPLSFENCFPVAHFLLYNVSLIIQEEATGHREDPSSVTPTQQSLRPVREPAGLIPHSCWLQKGVYDNRKPSVMSQRALTILSNGKLKKKKMERSPPGSASLNTNLGAKWNAP